MTPVPDLPPKKPRRWVLLLLGLLALELGFILLEFFFQAFSGWQQLRAVGLL